MLSLLVFVCQCDAEEDHESCRNRKRAESRLFRFPQTDLEEGKLRPVLLLDKLPGEYDDWLICMISSQTRQHIVEFDELVLEDDSDFASSGLRVSMYQPNDLYGHQMIPSRANASISVSL